MLPRDRCVIAFLLVVAVLVLAVLAVTAVLSLLSLLLHFMLLLLLLLLSYITFLRRIVTRGHSGRCALYSPRSALRVVQVWVLDIVLHVVSLLLHRSVRGGLFPVFLVEYIT